jgi:hypothetical protein
MEDVKVFERIKRDYSDLEHYLVKNELVDERRVWFAGYDNYRKATQNAIAGNLLYGNSKLVIMTIKGSEIYFLSNSKKGFRLRVIGSTDQKHKVSSFRHILYPTFDITCNDGTFYSVKVMKNKDGIKEFKKIVK